MQFIEALGLLPHPEGGFYREVYRSAKRFADRSAGTSIYVLIPPGGILAWHAVTSDELWHWYAGDSAHLEVVSPSGQHETSMLGQVIERQQRPLHVVPANHLQATWCSDDEWALCGCTVIPGFDFADWSMPSRSDLIRQLPHLADLMRRFSRDEQEEP